MKVDGEWKVGHPFVGCKNLSSIKVNSKNKYFTAKGGVLYNKNKTKLIAWPCAKKTENYKIPSSVKEIHDYAFYKARYLKSISIPKKVKIIDYNTFDSCTNLKSIKLPKKLYKIDRKAFYNCTNLKSISIPKNVKEIGAYAFKNCRKIKEIQISSRVKQFSINSIKDCSKLRKITFKNPNTKITNINDIPNSKKITIYGYKNSSAKKSAKKVKVKFKLIKSKS